MNDDRLSGRLGLLDEACRALDASALADATWEPHDWSEWPPAPGKRCRHLCCDLAIPHEFGAPGCCSEGGHA